MNLNIQAPINSLSYGIVGQYLVSSLNKAGINVSLFPISNRIIQDDIQNKENIQHIKKCLENAQLFDKNAPSLRLFHAFSLAEQIGSPKIGFPIFELDSFTPIELNHLNGCDLIIVPSKWAKSVIEKHCDVKCEVCPLGIDPSIFFPSTSNNNKNTVFLNCGKFEYRKGHDLIPELFADAFGPDDNVELWMMPHNFFLQPAQVQEWENFYKNSPLGNKIKILPRLTNSQECAKVMHDADCGLFPSRAEGWGLPILEMLACGKQIIVTNYSGQTEFCNKDNSLLVDITEFEQAVDGIWFNGQGNWAEINDEQIEQTINYMREVHKKKQHGESMVNLAGVETGKEFTWDNAAAKLIKILENL